MPAVLILVPEKPRMDAGKASLSAQCGAFSPLSSASETDFESYLQLNLLERGNLSECKLSVSRGLCWRLLPGFLLLPQTKHNMTFRESRVASYFLHPVILSFKEPVCQKECRNGGRCIGPNRYYDKN